MHGTNWFSFKHNTWATVTNDAVTKRGYYTVEFPETGMFRRYNAERINREVSEHKSIDRQLDAQLGVTMQAEARTVNESVSSRPTVQVGFKAFVNESGAFVKEFVKVDSKPVKKTKGMGKLIGLVFE